MSKENKTAEESYYYPLFKLLHEEHGLILLDSELNDIIDTVNKMQDKAELEAMEEYKSTASPAPGFKSAGVEQLEFAKWLQENTEVIKEDKITLYRYCDKMNEWGNYTLEDIYKQYIDNGSLSAPAPLEGKMYVEVDAKDELPPKNEKVLIIDEYGSPYLDSAIEWDGNIRNYKWLKPVAATPVEYEPGIIKSMNRLYKRLSDLMKTETNEEKKKELLIELTIIGDHYNL